MKALAAAIVLLSATARAQAPIAFVTAMNERGAERAFAALSRTLPAELGQIPGPDDEALHFLLISQPDATLEGLQALTFGAKGRPLDVLVSLRAEPTTCPEGVAPELVCRRTAALRLVADELERRHPALERRSLRAELGGKLRLTSAGRTLLELPVTGPNGSPSLEARLRVLVLRAYPRGAPAVGGTDAGARQVVERELATAAGVWAQCGVQLSALSVEVVDPPRGQLVAVGCDAGLPAAGGTVTFSQGSKQAQVQTRAGESPLSVARRLADALGVAGSVFENQRSAAEALPSADLWLRGAAAPRVAGSSDPSLPVCVTELDLSDGLSHFGDGDAFVGTPEERALLRAYDDGDPSTVELFVVPRFESSERIGESFIAATGSSLTSAVVLDRNAIAAGARSFALAHELGHVFLAMPGHPDDFGVDQSWSLMDADVADPTIFGPRRLSRADCARALAQSGPSALVPVLRPAVKAGR
ncbi:MAG: hypothetical protein EOO73_05875 [Myxococcales bacterium]|nr:MAG: hypothetical protein EOO73_05875 [Myxococcales bacterium]